MAQRLLMAHRHIIGDSGEAEPILIDTDEPEAVVLELDSGERIELDRGELLAAITHGEAA